MVKKLSILGSTGSIGTQTLEVLEWLPGDFQVAALTAQNNDKLLAAQAKKWLPEVVAIGDTKAYRSLKAALSGLPCTVLAGEEGILAAATLVSADMVVDGISGVAGLLPVIAALSHGKDVALANKEVLVAAGHMVTALAEAKGVRLLPVDSEHSAIFQCLAAASGGAKTLLLTASGGPFRDWDKKDLAGITPSMALKHPTWSMGQKITIDSATLMNKGLEIIEAHWLFQMAYEEIQVVVHPQSIIHSMVQMNDGAVLAHLGYPDMRVPIQFALTYPRRLANPVRPLDFAALGQLTFQAADEEKFSCLALAKAAGKAGGTAPAVLNAANEILVGAFLAEKIGFLDIPVMIEKVMNRHNIVENPDLETVLAADQEGRRLAALLASGKEITQ